MSYKYLFNLIAIKLHLYAVHREHSALTITFTLISYTLLTALYIFIMCDGRCTKKRAAKLDLR